MFLFIRIKMFGNTHAYFLLKTNIANTFQYPPLDILILSETV